MEELVGKRIIIDVKEWARELEEENIFHGMEGIITCCNIDNNNLEDSYFSVKFDNGIEVETLSGYHFILKNK